MLRSSSVAVLALVASLAACSGSSTKSAGQLDGLTISAGALNPAFDPAITAYSAQVPFDTLGVTITPTASADHAASITVSQDGGAAATVASGQPSATLAVPAHGTQSIISIVVTSASGATATYTVQLVRSDDSDATLAGLALSVGTLNPAFASTTTSYAVTIPSNTPSFKVTPTATKADTKSITVQQDSGTANPVANGAASVALTVPAAGATSTVAITVTAQNGYAAQTYTLTLSPAGNNDATLQSLTASAGTISPAFASGTSSYALAVPVGTTTVKLTPKANNANVRSIVLTQDTSAPQTIANNAASTALPVPAVGATSNISIKVTALDGSDADTYSIALTQTASNDAALSGLTISAGALSPTFAGATLGYSDQVPYKTASVTITPTADGAVVHSISVSQDGGAAQTLASGTASAAFTVPAVGSSSTLTVVVTAQDGTTQKTYTIALTQTPAADASLASLTTSAGSLSPAFSGAIFAYSLIAPHGTSTLTVTPTSTAAVTSITVKQDAGSAATVASGHASASLLVPAVGTSSTITIAVLSSDQQTTDTYTIALSQAASTDSTLSALALSGGALTPSFASNVTTYSLTAPAGTSSTTVTATAHDTAVKSITLSQDGGAASALTSGTASASLTIPAFGTSTVLRIVITAQDNSTTTYSITISVAASTDASLASLTSSAGALSSAFSGATFAYTLVAPHATANITFTPTASSALIHSLTLKQDSGAAASVASGQPSASLPVPAVGASSTITIVVVAQDGTTTDSYVISLSQAASTDSTLSALVVAGGSLRQVPGGGGFASNVTTYAVTVPSGTSTTTITATGDDPAEQTITLSQDGAPAAPLTSGVTSGSLAVPAVGSSTVLSVVVTAQNSSHTTYTITVNRAAATDATLTSLSISTGSLTPAFDSGTISYTVSVPFGTGPVTVTPTATSPNAHGITVAQDSGTPLAVVSGSASQSLAIPALDTTSTISVVVTAEDAVTQRTYTITLSQAHRNDSSLSGLSESSGNLAPAFAPATLSYTYNVPFQTGAYTVTATTNDTEATLTINGTAATSNVATPVVLSPGTQAVAVTVTSADATSTTTYTLNITEAAPISNIAVTVNSVAVTSGGTSVDFAGVATSSHKDLSFTITNSGTAALTISAASVTTDSTDYSIFAAPTSAVAALGGSTTMTVRLTPSSSGALPGAVTITNTSANQSSFVINLTGTGTDPVTGITVTSAGNATSIVGTGSRLQLTATAAPADASPAVTWSSNSASATVSSSGLVAAVVDGPVTITATATDGTGISGTLNLTIITSNFVSFLKQTPFSGTLTATAGDTSGTLTLSSVISASTANAYAYQASSGYLYGLGNFAFLAPPTTVSGDFSMSATVTLTAAPHASSAAGLGLGLTTGFSGTDRYAYYVINGKGSAKYVTSPTAVSTGSPAPTIALNTAYQMVFSRSGANLTYGLVGNTNTAGVSNFTDGTTVYGAGAVYPCLAFNNVNATVTNLVITDGSGNTIFNSATGSLTTFVPGALSLSASTASANKGGTVNVTAVATAIGGGEAAVTAVAADTTVASASVVNNATNSVITINGLKAGSTTVTVTNTGDTNASTNTKTVAVTVLEFNTTDNYGPLTTVYPAAGAAAAYVDGELSITFDSPPTLNSGGSIDIYNATGTRADRIFFAGETQTVAGVVIAVGSQLARVSGNTIYFTPHFNALTYGAAYYVGISTTAISGTLNNDTFVGLSNLNTVATWNFTTQAAPGLTSPVSVDGSQTSTANFRTVGGALMYLALHPIPSATAVAINVAAGTYTELVNYRATANPALTISISGPAGNNRGDSAIIQYANGGNFNPQNARASFYFAGANLVMQNLTLKNTGGRVAYAQAETLYFDSRTTYTVAVNNCSFLSHQDTIQTSGKAWFYNSFIEGNTDFLWGTSDIALFENVSLHIVNDSGGGGPFSIFVARTGTTIGSGTGTIGKGYVLLSSTVSCDTGIVCAYGRDAGGTGFYDQASLINNIVSGGGTLTTGLWSTATAPLSLGDSTYVGWKSTGNTGLGAETMTTATGTASTINSQSSEYDTRDHIINRVVDITSGSIAGYGAAASPWDVSSLATLFGAP